MARTNLLRNMTNAAKRRLSPAKRGVKSACRSQVRSTLRPERSSDSFCREAAKDVRRLTSFGPLGPKSACAKRKLAPKGPKTPYV